MERVESTFDMLMILDPEFLSGFEKDLPIIAFFFILVMGFLLLI